jgi:hypothetical protein
VTLSVAKEQEITQNMPIVYQMACYPNSSVSFRAMQIPFLT